MILFFTAGMGIPSSDEVRTPAVSGMFYPGDPHKLVSMIDEYLSKAKVLIKGDIGGLVSPHAGYVFSGPVAAWSYRQIMGKSYDMVVVIAPSHFERFPGVSIYAGKFYETPIGKITVDQELAAQLTRESENIRLSEKGHHAGFLGRGEHSLEVQLPFLQQVLKDFPLIPIVVSDQYWQTVKTLGSALARVLDGKKALIVASSDLSHYRPHEEARSIDQHLLDLFNAFEYRKILNGCQEQKIEACGYGPIAAMMYACSLLGYNKGKALKYATSGDVPEGEKAQVVGYMSGAVYR